MIIYNTDITSKEYKKFSKIKNRILAFGSIAILSATTIIFMGLYIHEVYKIPGKNKPDDTAKLAAEKDTIVGFLQRDIDRETPITGLKLHNYDILISLAQTALYPLADKNSSKAEIFNNADLSTVAIQDYAAVTKNFAKAGDPADWHTFINTSFKITIDANSASAGGATPPPSSTSTAVFTVSMNFDLNQEYVYEDSTALPILLQPSPFILMNNEAFSINAATPIGIVTTVSEFIWMP